MRLKLAAAIVLAGTLGGVQCTWAQGLGPGGTGNVASTTPITPFVIGGYIENFTLGGPGGAACPYSGGLITVNGQQIVIPDNTILVMPASQITMCDMFSPTMQPTLRPPAPGESGIALNDTVKPLAAYEVSIMGNIVNNVWIAGLVNIAQEFLNVHQGYITNIDYATGDFCISQNPVPPAALGLPRPGCLPAESRVKLNDPVGRYGKQRREGDQDPRFVVDDGNPTVHGLTGYPMCIPRVAPPAVDVVCPISNRPMDPPAGPLAFPALRNGAATVSVGGGTGRPLTRFVMDAFNLPPVVPGAAPIVGATDIISCRNGVSQVTGLVGSDCDSTQQVPMMIGDYVTINATRGQDSSPVNGGIYLSAWQVVAQVAPYTKPCGTIGTNPITDPTGAIANSKLIPPVIGPNAKCNPMSDITYMEWEVGLVGTQGVNGDGILVEVQDRIKVLGFTTDPSAQIEIYAIDTLNNLRWIANVVPERIVFGRYALFVQRDILKRLPVATTGGPIPIVDNHLGTDLGAPRQFYVHQAKTQALLGGKQRPHNVKPIPNVCGGLIFVACPPLNGTAVPTVNDLVNPATGKVFTIANGLVPSQYLQPIQEYITPESVQLGDPIAMNNFECMDFLVGGWAIHTPAIDAAAPGFINGGAGAFGVNQLNPWPGGMFQGATPPNPALETLAGQPTSIGVPKGVRCASLAPPGG
jgi:hypothetical protein